MYRGIFLLLIMVYGCAPASQDFHFYDATGRKYEFRNLNRNLTRYYGVDFSPRLVLLLTDEKESRSLKKQLDILESMDAEAFNVIYVIADTTREWKSSYHTSVKEAQRINTADCAYKILLYSNKGDLIHSSEKVMTANELKSRLSSAQR